MTRIELYVSDGRRTYDLTEYSNFLNAKIEYSLNVDDYSYYFEMRDVIVPLQAASMFLNPVCTVFDASVRFVEGNTLFLGRISLEDIEFFEKDYVKLNIRLDNLDEFLSKIKSIVLNRTHTTLVLREPQRDSAAVGLLLLGVSTAASIIFFTYSFLNARLTASAIASTGVGAPGAASYLVINYIVLAIYLAFFIVSLVQLARQIVDFIKSIRTEAYAFNLFDSILNLSYKAGNFNVDVSRIYGVMDVYIVTPLSRTKNITDEVITAAELIDVVKKTLNARLYIFNNTIRFINVQNTTVPPILKTSLAERYRYDTRDLQNIFLFSLQRDPAEGYSYLDVEVAYERRTECAVGYKRISIPYSPHRVKNFNTFIDRAYKFLLLTLFITSAGLGWVATAILRALNILKQYDPKLGHIIVEGEGWNAKIIKAKNISRPGVESENAYIRSIRAMYRNRLLRVVNTKVRLSPNDLYNLAQIGFESVRKLTYYVHDQYADVEYEEEVFTLIPYEDRFI